MEVFIKINEVLALWLANDRAELTIEGIFVMESGIGYFVSSMSDVDEKSRAVMVNFHGLEKSLLSSVPAYGGGKYSYFDNAMISGVLSKSPHAEFQYAIGRVHDFVVYKYGEGMNVNL